MNITCKACGKVHKANSKIEKSIKKLAPGQKVRLKCSQCGEPISLGKEMLSRVSQAVARRICEEAKVSTRASTKRIGRQEADSLYQAIQRTKIKSPSTDCISPIGEELLLKGLRHVVPGEFFRAPGSIRMSFGGSAESVDAGLERLGPLFESVDAHGRR